MRSTNKLKLGIFKNFFYKKRKKRFLVQIHNNKKKQTNKSNKYKENKQTNISVHIL